MRGRRILLVLVLLPLLTAPVRQEGRLAHGRVFPKGVTEIEVRPGELFSLHWRLGVVPGTDHRPVRPLADPGVLAYVGADAVPGDPEYLGDGGELYLVFKSRGRGTTGLTVVNCAWCDGDTRSSYGERDTYRITVR
ncbi:hypothetical protein ACIQBJ_19845 [Kitasatospora sp. NPDC088391]|uniref:hypothetical protein n=1 Tax=Kitasatospora sp. NPDC088391 TaxID=3364074 RepID=UPI0037F34A5B